MNSKRLNIFLVYWIPVICWMMVIFLFSANPTIPTSKIYWQDFLVKKTAHMIEYGILAGLLYRALKNSGVKKYKALTLSLVVAASYAFTDEYHQSFTPGREPRIRDVGFDTIGASLSLVIIWKFLPIAPKILKTWAKKSGLV